MIIGGKACCLLSPRSPHRWRALLSLRWSGSLPKSQWRLQLIVEESLYPLFLSSAEMSVPDLRRDKKVQTHPYLLPPPLPLFSRLLVISKSLCSWPQLSLVCLISSSRAVLLSLSHFLLPSCCVFPNPILSPSLSLTLFSPSLSLSCCVNSPAAAPLTSFQACPRCGANNQ